MEQPISWQHIFVEAVVVLIPILAAQWLTYRDSLKKAADRDRRWNFILTEHVPHSHGEEHGPLQAENIRFPKVRVNGEFK